MSDSQFKAGDVVKLRSGGPKMTVNGQSSDGSIICIWFEGHNPKRDVFAAESLKKVEEQAA